MSKWMQHPWMGWLALGLILINLSLLGGWSYQRYLARPEIAADTTQIALPDRGLGRFFREELQLTQDQHRAFREHRQQFHQQAYAITRELQQARNELLKAMDEPHPDKEKIAQYAESIGQLHTQLKQETATYYLALKNQCTPEQQSKLHQIFKEMLNATEVPVPQQPKPERRGPQRWQNKKQ